MTDQVKNMALVLQSAYGVLTQLRPGCSGVLGDAVDTTLQAIYGVTSGAESAAVLAGRRAYDHIITNAAAWDRTGVTIARWQDRITDEPTLQQIITALQAENADLRALVARNNATDQEEPAA